MVTYFTNGVQTTKHMTEWYFGKRTVANYTAAAEIMSKESGKTSFDFWQNGTGRLTIVIR